MDISIKTRLAMIMGFMALLMLGLGGIGLGGIVMTNQALEATYKDRLEPTKMIGRIMLLMNENRAQIILALQHNPENRFSDMHDHALTLHFDAIAKNRDEITAIVGEYKKHNLTADEQTLADKYAAARTLYVTEGLNAAVEALQASDYHKANDLLQHKVNPHYQAASTEAEALLQKTLETAKAEYDHAVERYSLIRNVAIGGTLAGILLVAVFGVMLIRSIVGPLDKAVGHFKDIAQGNLTGRIVIPGNDEVGQVLGALSAMQDELKAIIDKVVHASVDIQGRTSKLNAEMFQVVEHSETQHDRVQEVAAAMEEVSQSVTEVAASAEGTANAAVSSQGIVADSITQMTKSMDATSRVVEAVQSSSGTITELSQAIQRIGEITQTIKEIADQTNLLALNAAIEAARAGEQGRGFAVVADEVRKLAERTATSTTDISRTVDEIQSTTLAAVSSMERAVKEVEGGISMMQASGKNLDQITVTSNQVTDMAQHIAAAAKQQSVASEDVARNMERISGLIEDNTESAKQAWKDTYALSQTAEEMRALVERFKVAG
ncbi:MAG: methyl-accepting chemotaxis protein [Sulfuricellaceae bacterium]